MKLSTYISDLLYRYECVIVPDFGGFVTNTIPASISKYSKTFYPPHKRVSYNSHLSNNDGLLANYISSIDKMPYEHALNFIKFEVKQWKEELKQTDLYLDKIGKISLDKNNKIIFEPQIDINYLTTSFGLASIVSPEIKREISKKVIEIATEKTPIVATKQKEESFTYLKYAAVFIGLAILGLGANALYKNYTAKQQIIAEKKQQQQLEHKIESASFIIDEALPSITLPVSLDVKPYHVIGGAFRYPENATKMVGILKKKGYNARILGINKWGLTQVSYDSYIKRRKAVNDLHTIQNTEDSSAWLLVKDL